MAISVLILTLNEETNLPGCLKSVSWSDDIVVFDSFSTDRTVEIAAAAGVRVFRRAFDDYASQRNAALGDVTFRHPWVLMVDADERVTPEVRAEMEQVIRRASGVTLWCIRRKDTFLGRWLKRSSGYPTWFGRLFRVGAVWVEREVNEEYHTAGGVGYLQSHLIHYPFSKGLSWWLERHNRYSSMEARTLLQEVQVPLGLHRLIRSDPAVRRKCLKQLAYRAPLRPWLVFGYLYFVRLGLLEGSAGLTYCALRATYEYMIDLKVRELRRQVKGLPI